MPNPQHKRKSDDGKKALVILALGILMILFAFPVFGFLGFYVIYASIAIMVIGIPFFAIRGFKKDESDGASVVALGIGLIVVVVAVLFILLIINSFKGM